MWQNVSLLSRGKELGSCSISLKPNISHSCQCVPRSVADNLFSRLQKNMIKDVEAHDSEASLNWLGSETKTPYAQCPHHFGCGDKGDLLRRHSSFLAYTFGELDRTAAISTISRKFKLTKPPIVDSMLLEAASSCEVDEELLSLLQSTRRQLLGWIDIRPQEWDRVYSLFPVSLWKNFATISRDLDSLLGDIRSHAVIVDKSVEMAALTRIRELARSPVCLAQQESLPGFLEASVPAASSCEAGDGSSQGGGEVQTAQITLPA
ncbi:hypothetical protein SELMODRAFT_426805 [Selaginella moellendorffii]|uniref:Uncharacterized protein n=1 Tax=Selaginella moellendorffii TaxID=88036 RepID=D8SXJ5_SELML|nr:hypothetical protein SELMODRAFT_426805 [Selaginella moellendorffii]